MADQLSLRWLFLRNKGLLKQAGHFYVDFISWIYIASFPKMVLQRMGVVQMLKD